MTKEEHHEERHKEQFVKGNSFGASGFTLGILSIVLIGGYIGVLFSLIGGVFCFIQQKYKKTKLGKAGLILNILGLVLGILFTLYITPILAKLMEASAVA